MCRMVFVRLTGRNKLFDFIITTVFNMINAFTRVFTKLERFGNYQSICEVGTLTYNYDYSVLINDNAIYQSCSEEEICGYASITTLEGKW